MTETIFIGRAATCDGGKSYPTNVLLAEFIREYGELKKKPYNEKLHDEAEQALRKAKEEQTKRLGKYKRLLNAFWKMSTFDEDGNKKPDRYLFPYDLDEEDHKVYALESFIETIGNHNNGLHETSFDYRSFNKGRDMLFEEVTEEEMLWHAKKSCKDALNERMMKLKYGEDVLK